MADIANTVGTFLNLATTWYKSAVVRSTATATLKHHLQNFAQYHVHIWEPIETLFLLNKRQQQDPLVIRQAVRVLHLDACLSEWLRDAGFRRPKQENVFVLARKGRNPATAQWILIRRPKTRPGQLTFPFFGVIEKETAFIALFEKLKTEFDKLEPKLDGIYPRSYYPLLLPPAMDIRPYYGQPGGVRGLRGGYATDSDSVEEEAERVYDVPPVSGPSASFRAKQPRPKSPRIDVRPMEPTYYQPAPAPLHTGGYLLTKRQALRQEQMLQDLSERLERNIADIMISNGDHKRLRRRRKQREPLEEAHREVLLEKSIEAHEAEADRLRNETYHAEQESRKLRRRRRARHDLDDFDIYEGRERLGDLGHDSYMYDYAPQAPDRYKSPEIDIAIVSPSSPVIDIGTERVERIRRTRSREPELAEFERLTAERDRARQQRQMYELQRDRLELLRRESAKEKERERRARREYEAERERARAEGYLDRTERRQRRSTHHHESPRVRVGEAVADDLAYDAMAARYSSPSSEEGREIRLRRRTSDRPRHREHDRSHGEYEVREREVRTERRAPAKDEPRSARARPSLIPPFMLLPGSRRMRANLE